MKYPHGRHVQIDRNHPDAVGICQRTGFIHNRRDIVKQFEWFGNTLRWTGFWVGKDYLDTPNEQLRNPLLPPDPVPIPYPLPPPGEAEAQPPTISAIPADEDAYYWGD